MTPSEIRIGPVPRTVTTVTSGFELHADTEFFVNANYFGKILLVMISSSTTKNFIWSDLIYWQRPRPRNLHTSELHIST